MHRGPGVEQSTLLRTPQQKHMSSVLCLRGCRAMVQMELKDLLPQPFKQMHSRSMKVRWPVSRALCCLLCLGVHD